MAACETESVKIDVKAGHSHKLPTDVSTSMIFFFRIRWSCAMSMAENCARPFGRDQIKATERLFKSIRVFRASWKVRLYCKYHKHAPKLNEAGKIHRARAQHTPPDNRTPRTWRPAMRLEPNEPVRMRVSDILALLCQTFKKLLLDYLFYCEKLSEFS